MLRKTTNLLRVKRASVILGMAAFFGGVAWAGPVSVVIDSPVNDSNAVLWQQVVVSTTVTAEAGVANVVLAVNGVVIRRDAPSGWNPTSCRMSQSWTPSSLGSVVISVVAFDRYGASSDQVSIRLQVVEDRPVDLAGKLEPGVDKALASYTERVTEQIILAPGLSGSVSATCPAPSVLVGGGFASDPWVAVYGQQKAISAWLGHAKNVGSFEAPVHVYAVCLHNAPNASVFQAHGESDIAPGSTGQALAVCPVGSIVTGGGFFDPSGGGLRVYLSSKGRSTSSWQVGARNWSGSTTTLHSYALCLSGTVGSTRQEMMSTTVIPAGTGYVGPSCESDELVTGGGFSAEDAIIIYSNSGPRTVANDEWWVYGRNTHGSLDKTMTGYVVCAKLGIFADGFESGNTDLWSSTVP